MYIVWNIFFTHLSVNCTDQLAWSFITDLGKETDYQQVRSMWFFFYNNKYILIV